MLALWLAVLGGKEDRALFLEFHTRYEKKLYAVAQKMLGSPVLAEEAVQEAMVRVVNHFDEFKKYLKKTVMKSCAPALIGRGRKNRTGNIMPEKGNKSRSWADIAPNSQRKEV